MQTANGRACTDTDEYDTAVVVHEWGHYFESSFSRADSIGGPHGGRDLLDMRLAFGEAWGNSLAGMVRDDPLYVDTQGAAQGQAGVVFDLDGIDAGEPRGWFNEASVQHVLYQWYKAPSLGFPAIYKVMVGPQKDTPAFTTLFSFATYLRNNADDAGRLAIDQHLTAIHTVNGAALDIWGSNQVYPASLAPAPGGAPFVLPIYTRLVLNTPSVVCRTNMFDSISGNKLGNFRHLHLPIVGAGTYKLNITRGVGDPPAAAEVYRNGKVVLPGQEFHSEVTLPNLSAGDYTAVLTSDKADACMTVTLSQ